MPVPRQSWWRTAAVLTALTLLLLSSMVSLHGHTDRSADACVLCQFAHTPAIETAELRTVSPLPHGPLIRASVVTSCRSHEPATRVRDRAPPSIA